MQHAQKLNSNQNPDLWPILLSTGTWDWTGAQTFLFYQHVSFENPV